jgi:hypothetical protein
MDPVSQLLIVIVVGERSVAVAQAVAHQVKQRLAADSFLCSSPMVWRITKRLC